MFDVGFWEISLILVVMLIVVGPERLPGLARKAGIWISKARRMVAEVKSEVDRELQLDELKHSISKQANLDEFKQLAREANALENAVLKETRTLDPRSNKPILGKDMQSQDRLDGESRLTAASESATTTLEKTSHASKGDGASQAAPIDTAIPSPEQSPGSKDSHAAVTGLLKKTDSSGKRD
jgi:sec-independent protein translocase protein TatB